MSNRGKKECQNCKSIVGARLEICSCGYHFATKAVNQEMLEAKKAPKISKIHNRGKKNCPSCTAVLGARTMTCTTCHYAFPQKVKTVQTEVTAQA
jgi:hypothetical protein